MVSHHNQPKSPHLRLFILPLLPQKEAVFPPGVYRPQWQSVCDAACFSTALFSDLSLQRKKYTGISCKFVLFNRAL
jgi:hypothetical protein